MWGDGRERSTCARREREWWRIGGVGEDTALMSRFHKPPGVKTKTQTCTLPNFRAVWKRRKKKKKQ